MSNNNLENLKKLVTKNIEAGGFMNALRAQLKVEVYNIIEAQDQRTKDGAGFQWEHPLLTKIKGIAEGIKSLELILEYLEFFKLDYTAQVLRKEANLTEPIIRENLARKMGLDASKDSMRPILMILISEFGKPASAFDPKPQPKTSDLAARKKEDEESKKKEEEEQRKREEELKRKQAEDAKKKPAAAAKPEPVKKEQGAKDRPQTAPPPKAEPQVSNKIRGGVPPQKLSSMFGINMNQNVEEDDLFKKPDPYSMPMKGAMQDPYQYELEPKKKQYDYDPAKTIGKPGNKFNNPVPLIGEEVEEDINFGESREDKTKHSNLLFTSDEDYRKASQSMGVDESVDSLALEEYDYYEDVKRKQ